MRVWLPMAATGLGSPPLRCHPREGCFSLGALGSLGLIRGPQGWRRQAGGQRTEVAVAVRSGSEARLLPCREVATLPSPS